MEISIRQEEVKDYQEVEQVVEKAFLEAEMSDYREHELVRRLRVSAEFIPELSLVALAEEKLVGHILLTKIEIRDEDQGIPSLALAPVAILPEYQGQGIGKILIELAVQKAKDLGYSSIIVLGHEKYYPKFGFVPTSKWGIKPPFEVPEEVFMGLELVEGALQGVKGTVVYSKAFFE
ncbi:MAG: N-acetyltransferase [Cellulosilyticaceae bacterium]